MNKEKIDIGFGVCVEKITSESAVIHNLESEGKPVRNLGVKFLE